MLIALIAVSILLAASLGVAGHLLLSRSASRMERDAARREAETLRREVEKLEAREQELEDLLGDARANGAAMQERIEAHERRAKEWTEQLDAFRKTSESAFNDLAGRALRASNEQFLQLAREAFKAEQEKAKQDLESRKRAVDDLLKPIGEALKRTDEKLSTIEKGRVQTSAELSKHITMMVEQTKELGAHTQRLVQSLRSPHVRGRWGEMTLRRVVELAGMSEHCDFSEQTSMENDNGGRLRPDMTIHLPGERVIVVDAKTPLSAYLEALEAETEEDRKQSLVNHARQLRQRVEELASKRYAQQFDRSPDFVVLFVPGDHFLSAALREEPQLLDRAAASRVIITTPATLIALLKAVAFGWSQASLADDARAVLELGRQLHDRVATMTEHLARMGKSLSGAVKSYNDLLGNVERRVIPSATKLVEHNVRSHKSLREAASVDESPRVPQGLPETVHDQRDVDALPFDDEGSLLDAPFEPKEDRAAGGIRAK